MNLINYYTPKRYSTSNKRKLIHQKAGHESKKSPEIVFTKKLTL